MNTNGTSRLLGKQDILEADDIIFEQVSVPEWGGEVVIKSLSGSQRDAFEATIFIGKGDDRDVNMQMLRAKLAAASIVDPETHERMFSDNEITLLGQKSARALQRVFNRAQELNGMTREDVEELVGNSENGQSADSGSDSLWPSEVAP